MRVTDMKPKFKVGDMIIPRHDCHVNNKNCVFFIADIHMNERNAGTPYFYYIETFGGFSKDFIEDYYVLFDSPEGIFARL